MDAQRKRSPYGKPCIVKMQFILKANSLQKYKRFEYEQKVKTRRSCRKKLFSFNTYIQNSYDDFVMNFASKATWPMEFSASRLASLELNHITGGALSLFNIDFGPFETKPHFREVEAKLKASIQYSLSKLPSIPLMAMDHGMTRNHEQPDCSASFEALADALRQLDNTLSDCVMPLLSFTFIMKCFTHLMLDKSNLLGDEIKLLMESNTLLEVETEAKLLLQDKKLLMQIPRTIQIGIFELDISDVHRCFISSIDDSISNLFTTHIGTKFESLLETNHERFLSLKDKLLQPMPELKEYIEMKRFLEGEEIGQEIELIQQEIKLCRSLSKFEEEVRRSSVLISQEYLESLGWVNELKLHHESSLRKMRETLPRFIEELGRLHTRLVQEFNQTVGFIREFDYFNDDKEADMYYMKARELGITLDGYMLRAADISSRQEILGMKSTSFEAVIMQEKTKFNRYLDLWNFIANEWNPEHNNWKKEPFVKLDKGEMGRVISDGLFLLQRLQLGFRENETVLRLVKNKHDEVSKFSAILEIVRILKDPSYKERHWDELFNQIKESDKNDSLGLKEGRPDLQKVTLGQLMLANIISQLPLLRQIFIRADTEAKTELRIKEIRSSVEGMVIKSTIFDLDNTGLSLITGIKGILSKINEHQATITSMLSIPEYPEVLTRELRSLFKLVTFVSDIFSRIQLVQSKLVKFSPLFKFRDVEKYLSDKNASVSFTKVREDFKKLFTSLEDRKMRLFIDIMGSEDEEHKTSELLTRLDTMGGHCDSILDSLNGMFKVVRRECPRYNFCSEETMLSLCSLIKFPKSFMMLIVPLFKGLSGINTTNHISTGEAEKIDIPSVVSRSGELINFDKAVVIELHAAADIPLITVVKELETSLHSFMESSFSMHLQCLVNHHFDFTLIYSYWREGNPSFQILTLCMQVLFDFEISMLGAVCKSVINNPKYIPLENSLITRLSALRDRIFVSVKTFINYPIKFLKEKMKDSNSVVQLDSYIQLAQAMLSTLDGLIKSRVTSSEDFDFQVIPKYSMIFDKKVKVHQDDQKKVAFDEIDKRITDEITAFQDLPFENESSKVMSTFTSLVENIYIARTGTTLVWSLLTITLPYSFELVAPGPLFLKPPPSTVLTILHSLHQGQAISFRGPATQGKTTLLRMIGSNLGRSIFEVDLSQQSELSYSTMTLLARGALTCGCWLFLKNLQTSSLSMLSIVSHVATEMINTIALGKSKCSFIGEIINLRPGHALVSTYDFTRTDSQAKYEGSQLTQSDSFRIVCMHHPDYSEIISGMATLVFDSENTRKNHSNRLILFCKLLPETVGSSLPTLTLRDLFVLCSKALSAYFRSLDTYYGTFKGKDGKERLDLNVLCMDSGLAERYIVCLRKGIIQWASSWGESKHSQSHIGSLFDNVLNDGKSMKDSKVLSASNSYPSESSLVDSQSLLRMITTFKEIDQTVHIPDIASKFIKTIDSYLTNLLTPSPARPHIIVGNPLSQKSTLIKILSFIESEMSLIKFPVFWFNLQTLSKEDLFGDGTNIGIFKEFFIQSNSLNQEEKHSMSSTKINLLFQPSADLYLSMSDPRGVSELKVKKSFERSSSWLVLDANTAKQSPYFADKFSRVMSMITGLYENREINSHMGFSNKLKMVVEANSLAWMEPQHVSQSNIIIVKEHLMTLEDVVLHWIKLLSKEHEFFKMVSSKVSAVCLGLVVPIMFQMEDGINTSDVMYFTSNYATLHNFLKIFEIHLNEFRKYYMSYSLAEAKTNPESFYGWKEQFTLNQDNKPNNKGKTLGDPTQLVTNKRQRQMDGDQILELKGKEDIEQLETRKIEGLALFCLSIVLNPFILAQRYEFLTLLVERQAVIYCGMNKIQKHLFGDGLFKLVADKRLSGGCMDISKYIYDFSRGRWTSWETYRFTNKIEINSSFNSTSVSKNELARLNCKNSPAYLRAENTTNASFSFVNPLDRVVIPTTNTNQMRYILNLFVNYKRHLILVSEPNQGKTSFITDSYLRDLIEQREVVAFTFVMQKGISPKTVQTQVENSLLRVGSSVVCPPENKKIIVVIEDIHIDNLADKPYELARSLQTQNGWYSSNKKTFISVQDCSFIMTCSLPSSNREPTNKVMSSINPDLLHRSALIRTHNLSLSDLTTIFFEQVKNHIDPNPMNPKERLVSNLLHQFVKTVYYNKDMLNQQAMTYKTNLTLSSFIQFAKSLNLVEWENIADEQTNVLYTWVKCLASFFSADRQFSESDIETLVRDKRGKMDIIKGLMSVSVFDSFRKKTLCHKINQDIVGHIKEEKRRITVRNPLVSSITSSHMVRSPSLGVGGVPLPSVMVIQPPPEESVIQEEDENSKDSDYNIHNAEADSQSKSDGPMDSPDPNPRNGRIKKDLGIQLNLIPITDVNEKRIRSVVTSPRNADMADKVFPKGKPYNLTTEDLEFKRSRRNSALTPGEQVFSTLIPRLPTPKHLTNLVADTVNRRKSLDVQFRPEDLTMEGRSRASSKRGSRIGSIQGSASSSSDEESIKKSVMSAYTITRSRKQSTNSDQEAKQLFVLDSSVNPEVYLKSFIEKTIDIKTSIPSNLNDILVEVVRESKHLFDESLLKEIREMRENKDDNEDHAFLIADSKTDKEIMAYMKASIKNYVRQNPESIFFLKLDGGNWSTFMQEYTSLIHGMMVEGQHIFLSSVKNVLYTRTLVQFAATTLKGGTEYLDIMNCCSTANVEDKVIRLNPFDALLEMVLNSFSDVWKLKMRFILLVIPNEAVKSSKSCMLEKILEFISALVLNTDAVIELLGSRFKEMIGLARKDKQYILYTDYELKYTIKSRLQAKLSFIVVNDCTSSYLTELRSCMAQIPAPTDCPDLFQYMFQHYHSLAVKFVRTHINGFKLRPPEDAPEYYSHPFPLEDSPSSLFFSKSLAIELNILRVSDREKKYIHLHRPIQESLILFNSFKSAIKLKLDFSDAESHNSQWAKEVLNLVHKIERRKEVVVLELKEIEIQIKAKQKEEADIGISESQLLSRRQEWIQKKQECEDTHLKLEENLEAVSREERLVSELKESLQNTIATVSEYREVDVQMNFIQGAFNKTSLFVVYSVVFLEMFGVPTTYPISEEDLVKLSEDTADRAKHSLYCDIFEEICLSFNSQFLVYISTVLESNSLPGMTLPKANHFSSIVQGMADSKTAKGLNAFQKVIFKMVDTAVEIVRLDLLRGSRDAEKSRLENNRILLGIQRDRAQKAVILIEEGLKELPLIMNKIHERLKFLQNKKNFDQEIFGILTEMASNLSEFQGIYATITQPLMSPRISRDEIIEFLSLYITICSKYPWGIKKKMAYLIIKESNLSSAFLDELPIYSIIGPDHLLIDTLRSRIPCNLNLLTNISIVELLQEEQTLPYPCILDRGKLFLKWITTKYPKGVYQDRHLPSPNIVENLELCMKNGNAFVALDPSADLLRYIRPVIDWQFRRFAESALISAGQNIELTDIIHYFGKKLHVNKGFFLYIILEDEHISDISDSIFSLLLTLNNDVDEQRIFSETVADQMVVEVEGSTRSMQVTDYINKSISAKVVEQYKSLIEKIKNFDFLKDSLESPTFTYLREEMDGFQLLVDSLNRQNKDQKIAVDSYRLAHKAISDLQFFTNEEQEEYDFLTYPYGLKIPNFTKMITRYLPHTLPYWKIYSALGKLINFSPGSVSTGCLENIVLLLKQFLTTTTDHKLTVTDIESRSELFTSLLEKVETHLYINSKNSLQIQVQSIFAFIMALNHSSRDHDQRQRLAGQLEALVYPGWDGFHGIEVGLGSGSLGDMIHKRKMSVREYYRDNGSCSGPLQLIHIGSDFLALNNSLRAGIKVVEEMEVIGTKLCFGMPARKLDEVERPPSPSLVITNNSFELADSGALNHAIDLIGRRITSTERKTLNREDRIRLSIVLSSASSVIDRKKLICDLVSIMEIAHPDMKPREFSGRKLTFRQIVSLVDLVVPSLQKELLVLNILPNGEPLTKYMRERPMSGSPDVRNRGDLLKRESFVPDQEDDNNNSPQSTRIQMGFSRIAATVTGVKKSSQIFIEGVKVKRAVQKEFLENTLAYLQMVFEHQFGFEPSTDIFDYEDSSWSQFLFAPISQDTELPLQKNNPLYWDPCSSLALARYCRPDLLRFLMARFYPIIRGEDNQLKETTNLNSFYPLTSNKRISVLLLPESLPQSSNPVLHLAAQLDTKTVTTDLSVLSVEELRDFLDQANKKMSWAVLTNIYALQPSNAFHAIKEINSFLEKSSTSHSFRIWIMYSGIKPLTVLPPWLSTCIYILLIPSSSVADQMVAFSKTELTYTGALTVQEINTKLTRGDKTFIKVTSAGTSGIDPIGEYDEDKKSETEIALRRFESKGKDNNFETFIENPKETEAQIVLIEKKVRCDFIFDIQAHGSSKAHLNQFEDNKARIKYLTKFIISLLYQRKVKLLCSTTSNLASSICPSLPLLTPRQIDSTLEFMLIVAGTKGCPDVYQTLVCCMSTLLHQQSRLDDPSSSLFLIHHFLKLYVAESPRDEDMSVKLGSEKYLIPSKNLVNNSPGTVFLEGILSFPQADGARILGFKTNDEMALMEKDISLELIRKNSDIKDLVRLSTSGGAELNGTGLNELIEDNKKTVSIDRVYLLMMDYGNNVVLAHSYHQELNKDLKKMIDDLLDTFSEHNLAKFHIDKTIPLSPTKIPYPDTPSPLKKKRSNSPQKVEEPIKAEGREKILAGEIHCLHRLGKRLFRDLQSAKFYLEGKTHGVDIAQSRHLIESIANNKVPDHWNTWLNGLNLDLTYFQSLILSILRIMTHLSQLCSETRRNRPWDIHLSSLIFPQSVLLILLSLNSDHCEVPLATSVLMVAPHRSEKDKIYEKSTGWTLLGVKIRGGTIDSFGRLSNEPDRELLTSIGTLHLEFTQFDDRLSTSMLVGPLFNSGR